MEKPLSDIRVIDLTHVWFGPWCTLLLAGMGAEVIRVEPPWGAIDRLSESMLFGGVPYTFHHLNLNKKDLTLNLKTPEGIEIFKKLLKISDVVVQNMTVGTMDKLGLGYEVLKEINPNIIYAALSGFGQTGPYRGRKSYAMIAEAMSGHTRLTGDGVDPEGPPIEMAQAYGDLGPGTLAAMGIIAAIRYRDHTGKGQMLDVAQLDCMVAFNTALTGYNLSGMKPHELRKKYPSGGVGGLLQTRDDKWVRISAYSPKAIDNIRALMESEEVDREMLEEWVRKRDRDEVIEDMNRAGIAAAPIYHVDETVQDPHLKEREMFVEVKHPLAGKIKVPNFPFKMSETPGEIERAAPILGQDNQEILVELLGFSEEEYKELQHKGVITYT
jgi:crotonobetainyl-CoA:carnitine CoA-transferase CaiB-like acyl-CoA transferase